MNTLTQNIAKLQDDIQLLANSPVNSQSTPDSPSSTTDKLLEEINEKLENLCSNHSSVSADMVHLKQSIESVHTVQQQNLAASASHAPAPSAPSPSEPSLPTVPTPPEPDCDIDHKQVPHSQIHLDFISSEEADQLSTFFASCDFKQENGHSVVSFGEPYSYTGSKSSNNVPPIPNELKFLLDKVNTMQSDLLSNESQPVPEINSILINKYDGSDSYLPKHSDREVTLHPESSIFTVSLGQSCDIKFVGRSTGSETLLPCPLRSMYHMTRRSQEVYEHLIEKGSIESGVRYSITFRAVCWKNKNATCLLGDSNTGMLRFGSDKRGTFGELMPGRKFWSPKIEDIDPVSCMGYANVVLLCGINDVRQPSVKSDADIAECYAKLKQKVRQIQFLSPSTRAVFVCRLLPSKDSSLYRKIDMFNRLIHYDLVPTCKDVVCVGGFERFARNHVLAEELSKRFDSSGRPDTLHLNRSGARVLAGLIKNSVFLRLHGGIDRRKHRSRVDGRSYSGVLAGSWPAPQRRSW
jgi:alkylated DNA repair dioxygenase AlkB